jgi:hypothetical protein
LFFAEAWLGCCCAGHGRGFVVVVMQVVLTALQSLLCRVVGCNVPLFGATFVKGEVRLSMAYVAGNCGYYSSIGGMDDKAVPKEWKEVWGDPDIPLRTFCTVVRTAVKKDVKNMFGATCIPQVWVSMQQVWKKWLQSL